MIGRLLGANEMAIALLKQEQNDTAQKVAEVLAGISVYFMEDVDPGRKALEQ